MSSSTPVPSSSSTSVPHIGKHDLVFAHSALHTVSSRQLINELFDGELSDQESESEDGEAWLPPPNINAADGSIDYQIKEPGRLLIRHRVAKCCPYIIPIKVHGTSPMASPPITVQAVKYSCPLEVYTRRRSTKALTTGKHGHRGHGKHRKRQAEKEAAETRRRETIERNLNQEGPSTLDESVAGDKASDEWIPIVSTPLLSRVWIQRHIHQPDANEHLQPSPFHWYNQKPDYAHLTHLMAEEMALRPLVTAPDDGWFVMPVNPQFPPSVWAWKSFPKTRSLESWGLAYFVLRSPRNTIGTAVQRHILTRIIKALDGEDQLHSGIESFTSNATRSPYLAKHLGFSSHYGKDIAGPGGLHLTKDTFEQRNKDNMVKSVKDSVKEAKTDSVKRLLVVVQEHLAPVITRYIRYLDPVFYQAQLMIRQRVSAYHGKNLKDWALDFGGMFYCIAVGKGHSSRTHIDSTDNVKSYAFVVPFGEFDGSNFVLPSRRLSVPVKPGQFIAVTASFLPHYVAHTIGMRYALTLFTDEFIAGKACNVMLQMGLHVSDLNFAA